MATVEQLKEMLELNRKKGKHLILEFAHGIWIHTDAFLEVEYGIRFYRNGRVSGVVRKDVFEKVKWGKPLKKPKPEQGVSARS